MRHATQGLRKVFLDVPSLITLWEDLVCREFAVLVVFVVSARAAAWCHLFKILPWRSDTWVSLTHLIKLGLSLILIRTLCFRERESEKQKELARELFISVKFLLFFLAQQFGLD